MRNVSIYTLCLYLIIIPVTGAYGSLFSDFVPNKSTELSALYLSIASFIFLIFLGHFYLKKYKEKAKSLFMPRYKFYIFGFLGLPFVVAVFSLFQYSALSVGLPNIFTSFSSESEIKTVHITSKRLWGRRDRNEEVSISGFNSDFPVSRRYYDSVSVGQTVTVNVKKSRFGIRVEFMRP